MKYLLFLCSLLLVISCNQKQEKEGVEQAVINVLDYSDVTTFTPFSTKVDSLLQEWPSFTAFNGRIQAISSVVSIPDLKLLVDELIEKEQQISQEAYPEVFNLPEIKSRQRLIRTYLLKTQSAIVLAQDPRSATDELLLAFNALRAQMNLISSPKIDLNTLENDF